MSNWPMLNAGARMQTLGGENLATLLTATGSTNALGAWSSLGTTSYEYRAMVLTCTLGSSRSMIDLGIGSSGSQVVIAKDIHFESNGNIYASSLFLPLCVPAGAEIWGRQRNSSASQQAGVNVTGIGGEWLGYAPGHHLVELLNPQTSDTTAAGAITASGNSGSDSAWAELVASTSKNYAALMVAPTLKTDLVRTSGAFAIDLAIGGSGSEIEIVSNLANFVDSNQMRNLSYAGPFPLNLPANTRIAGRVRCNSASADSFGVAVLGVVP